jgi:DNA-directed RNA polymerase specialized sigma24 family protein
MIPEVLTFCLDSMSSPESSESLLVRAQAGDRGAFGELVARVRGRLEAVVRSRMGAEVRGRVEPDDVVQPA